jgi:AcrR family transcriptional regulator
MPSKIDGKILDTAISCFADRGYHGTTTKEIAVAANVTEGSVFRLFRSKENLFEQALRKVVSTQMAPEQFAELMAREGDFCEVVHAAVRRWYTAVTPEYARLAMFANLSTPQLARDIVYKRVRNFVPVLADAIDRHKGHRRGGKTSTVCAQNFMFGLFYYRLTKAVINHRVQNPTTEREYLQTAVEGFLRAMEVNH